MKLTKKMTTEQVKKEFNHRFPMLKIEFYNKKHATFSGSSKENLIVDEKTLIALNPKFKDGEISLEKDIKVNQLEEKMEELFGLHIQVFRKSGEQWMQTSITDSWTLGKQEESGENQAKFANL